MSRSRPSPPMPEDEALALRRCLAGDVDAFEPLVKAHAPRIVRLAYHFLGDWDEARDVAQEAFARAYLALGRYDPGRSFGSWLCTIAARLATDRVRHRKAVRRAELRRPAGVSPPDADAALGIREALAILTPHQRQAVVLCDLHGFSAQEAARVVGCSASTVRVLRFLARRRMREALSRTCPAGAGDGLAAEGAE